MCHTRAQYDEIEKPPLPDWFARYMAAAQQAEAASASSAAAEIERGGGSAYELSRLAALPEEVRPTGTIRVQCGGGGAQEEAVTQAILNVSIAGFERLPSPAISCHLRAVWREPELTLWI